jgi:hypothetical protein
VHDFHETKGLGTIEFDMPAFLLDIACMKAKAQVQYTLRQIPQALDEALRRKSQQDGKSINQTAIEVLHTGLALNGDSFIHRDLDFVVGTWVEDPAFDQAIQSQDRVDPKLWR